MPETTPSRRYFVLGLSVEPKRSELSEATGLAPIVNMSLSMPPTPVAAPWYGSMKDGWLWLSILKATARPSPISTMPAFSPGPCNTNSPLVGKPLRCFLDDLYEQCSLHMTENMPSSRRFGSLPRELTILWYSSGVNPCSLTTCSVIFISSKAPILFRLLKKLHMQGVKERGTSRTLHVRRSDERR